LTKSHLSYLNDKGTLVQNQLKSPLERKTKFNTLTSKWIFICITWKKRCLSCWVQVSSFFNFSFLQCLTSWWN